jgi:hypothetical protein
MDSTNGKEIETIDGFDILKRELTEEESTREITLERFQEWHCSAGEDFVDQYENINAQIFGGYLMCMYPNKSSIILNALNKKYPSVQSLKNIYENDDDDKFYTDLASFINLTVALKKRVNQILIQVVEYYKD